MDLSFEVIEQAKYWSTSKDFSEETRREVASVLAQEDLLELTDRFYKNLEFGTGGLRGIIGAGTARMNVYNIRKATTAWSYYLKRIFKGQQIKIAISYDSRHFSREFAQNAVEVLAYHGIYALLTNQMRPVPMLSFMVRHYHCHGGLCITASHNPPNYNGYKVYLQSGGQLVPPHDAEIIKEYNNIKNYKDLPYIAYAKALADGFVEEIGSGLDDAYFSRIKALSVQSPDTTSFKIVYSPLHGTGIFAVPKALALFGFKDIVLVEEQSEPDGNFPTVTSPNPEDFQAMKMALELGEKTKADLIIATDPDADRIGLVARIKNEYVNFNGNQLGSLLFYYILSSLHEKNLLKENSIIINTIVTTELHQKIAESFGVKCVQTLTGFKWICSYVEEHPAETFICGCEESSGFLAGDFVRDKDSIISSALAAEMTCFYKNKNMNLLDVLDEIFIKYGLFWEGLHTVTLPGKKGADTILQIMAVMRANFPLKCCDINLKRVLDYQDHSIKVREENLFVALEERINLPKTNLLQFVFEDGTKVSLRPSGTEPKIKLYLSVQENVKSSSQKELEELKVKAQEKLKKFETFFVDQLMSIIS